MKDDIVQILKAELCFNAEIYEVDIVARMSHLQK